MYALYMYAIFILYVSIHVLSMYAEAKWNIKKNRCASMRWSFFLLDDHTMCFIWMV